MQGLSGGVVVYSRGEDEKDDGGQKEETVDGAFSGDVTFAPSARALQPSQERRDLP